MESLHVETTKLKKRSDLHLARKLWHMLGVFSIFSLYQVLPSFWSNFLILLAFVMFVPFDFLRHKFPKLNDWVLHAFGPIMRQNEVKRLAGTTYLIVGVAICILLFPRNTVSLSLLFLAFADPIASYIGIRWGKDKIFGHKSIQGFIAAYIVCAIASFIFLSILPTVVVERVLVFSLIAGWIGAFAELIPILKLDDNLTLPVMSGLGLQILFYFFGFFS